MALTYSKEMMIGEKAPEFTLPGVDGKNHSLAEIRKGKKAVVVMFICNHCPYVKAYFDRLIALTHALTTKGVLFVGINPNDEKNYPEDSFDHMVTLAKKKAFPFAYLRDKDQRVAHAYEAVCTPEIYVVDESGIIRFHGGIDDNWQEPEKVTKHYLRNAIDDIFADRTVKEPTPHAFGCSIKWE